MEFGIGVVAAHLQNASELFCRLNQRRNKLQFGSPFNMTEDKLHVIVVGAGLAGLAIAHGLQRNNIHCTIVDRETTPRDRNWGITLSWALPLLSKLLPEDLYDNLQACQPDPSLDGERAGKEGILIRDGATGGVKIRVQFPVIRRVNIQKTKTNLGKGLNIKYGKKLVDIIINDDAGHVNGVTAKFEDGTDLTGSVIVGADGGNSMVRRWLLGELAAQEVLPYAFMNFPFTLPAERARWLDSVMNPNVDVAPHPKSMYIGLFQLDKPDLDRPETWVYYILTTWPITTKEDEENTDNRMERFKVKAEGWADPFKGVVDALPDDLDIKPDQLRIWHPKPWNNQDGRVTLAGDAAHR